MRWLAFVVGWFPLIVNLGITLRALHSYTWVAENGNDGNDWQAPRGSHLAQEFASLRLAPNAELKKVSLRRQDAEAMAAPPPRPAAAWRPFAAIQADAVDPLHRPAPDECRWYQTGDCSPLGRVDPSLSKGCLETLPPGASGFCQCANGSLFGKSCSFAGLHAFCADVCGSRPAFPGHFELQTRYAAAKPTGKTPVEGYTRHKVRGAFTVHSTTKQLGKLLRTLTTLTEHFNGRNRYPIVVSHDSRDVFTPAYTAAAEAAAGGARVSFVMATARHWAIPSGVNASRIVLFRNRRTNRADSVHHRQRNRYLVGFLLRDRVFDGVEYVIRIELGAIFLCEIPFDPFVLMQREGKDYGFSSSFQGDDRVMPSLSRRVAAFIRKPDSNHAWKKDPTFRVSHPPGVQLLFPRLRSPRCIASGAFVAVSLSFVRSPSFAASFRALDATGGFIYEHWSFDAAVSMLASVLLPEAQWYYFESVAVSSPLAGHHVPADLYTCRNQPVPPRIAAGAHDWRQVCMKDLAHLADPNWT
ncbi:hypothetical protein DIPPA_33285 [Diplonema papillatum]|nr:hypothetical protein DIPPA_33285 [Diplonema papillatum]